jgi:hypothetical protein
VQVIRLHRVVDDLEVAARRRVRERASYQLELVGPTQAPAPAQARRDLHGHAPVRGPCAMRQSRRSPRLAPGRAALHPGLNFPKLCCSERTRRFFGFGSESACPRVD